MAGRPVVGTTLQVSPLPCRTVPLKPAAQTSLVPLPVTLYRALVVGLARPAPRAGAAAIRCAVGGGCKDIVAPGPCGLERTVPAGALYSLFQVAPFQRRMLF